MDFEAQGKGSGKPSGASDEPAQRNMHLPPHWRGVRTSADTPAAATTVEVNVDALLSAQQVQSTEEGESFAGEDTGVDIPDVD